MSTIKAEDAIHYLLIKIPEIRPFYEKRCIDLYAHGLPDVVFGSILVEYITMITDEGSAVEPEVGTELIARIFEMIEELATSSDFDARCLVEVSILESLLGEKGGLRRFGRYMRGRTRAMAINLAKQWGNKGVRGTKGSGNKGVRTIKINSSDPFLP